MSTAPRVGAHIRFYPPPEIRKLNTERHGWPEDLNYDGTMVRFTMDEPRAPVVRLHGLGGVEVCGPLPGTEWREVCECDRHPDHDPLCSPTRGHFNCGGKYVMHTPSNCARKK